jgi:hypothetical protein
MRSEFCVPSKWKGAAVAGAFRNSDNSESQLARNCADQNDDLTSIKLERLFVPNDVEKGWY